jgi:hypothetical protein
MTKKPKKKSAKERIAASLSRIEIIEAEEFARRLLGNAGWNSAEERREKKFQEIMQSLSAILGPNVDLEQEATAALEMWDETVGMEDALRDQTPFELLLREYHNISKEMMRIQDDLREGFANRGGHTLRTGATCR